MPIIVRHDDPAGEAVGAVTGGYLQRVNEDQRFQRQTSMRAMLQDLLAQRQMQRDAARAQANQERDANRLSVQDQIKQEAERRSQERLSGIVADLEGSPDYATNPHKQTLAALLKANQGKVVSGAQMGQFGVGATDQARMTNRLDVANVGADARRDVATIGADQRAASTDKRLSLTEKLALIRDSRAAAGQADAMTRFDAKLPIEQKRADANSKAVETQNRQSDMRLTNDQKIELETLQRKLSGAYQVGSPAKIAQAEAALTDFRQRVTSPQAVAARANNGARLVPGAPVQQQAPQIPGVATMMPNGGAQRDPMAHYRQNDGSWVVPTRKGNIGVMSAKYDDLVERALRANPRASDAQVQAMVSQLLEQETP